MKTIENLPLALPCPAWHTLDSRDEAAMSRFFRMLWEATPRGILEMLQEHERFVENGLRSEQFTLLPEGGYGFVDIQGMTRYLPSSEAGILRSRADSVTYWIKSEIVSRYTRGVVAREEAVAKAASTRRIKSFAMARRAA